MRLGLCSSNMGKVSGNETGPCGSNMGNGFGNETGAVWQQHGQRVWE